MKKKIIVLAALSAMALSSCTLVDNIKNMFGGFKSSQTSETTDTGEHDEAKLQVTVLAGSNPLASAGVIWCNGSECHMAQTNAQGVAVSDFTVDENVTYDVHVTVPEDCNYTYNPNIYSQKLGSDLTITLSEVIAPVSGDGSFDNPYVIAPGAYVVNVSSADELVYYAPTASTSGVYELESWVQEDSVLAPKGYDYNMDYYKFEKEELKKTEGSINWKASYELYSDSIYDGVPSFTPVYAFGASKAGSYSFNFSRAGDVEEVIAEEVEVKSTLTKYADAEARNFVTDVDLLENHVLAKDADGVYHLDSVEGPEIVMNIGRASKYLGIALSDPMFAYNLISSDGTKTYANFISIYESYSNSDYVYPLNDELCEFARNLAADKGFFDEFGTISWIISDEDPNYVKGQDDDVLYLCGYYEEYGSQEKPIVLNNSATWNETLDEIEIAADEALYCSFTRDENETSDVKVIMTPSNEEVVISEVGMFGPMEIYPNENGECELLVTDALPYIISLTRRNGDAGNVGMSYYLSYETPELDVELYPGYNSIEATQEGTVINFTNDDIATVTYVISSEDPNIQIEYNETTYTIDENPIHIEVELASFESFSFTVKCITPDEGYDSAFVSFNFDYVYGVGSFSPSVDQFGLNVKFRAPKAGKYEVSAGPTTKILWGETWQEVTADSPYVFEAGEFEEIEFTIQVLSDDPYNVAASYCDFFITEVIDF